jgi:hypothetical protein
VLLFKIATSKEQASKQGGRKNVVDQSSISNWSIKQPDGQFYPG